MLSRILSTGLLAIVASGTACAADIRIRTLFYDPSAIVTIAGRPNIESTISFAPDERIENVAIGDSAGWQITPNRRANLLFVKLQQPRGRTNLTVVTDQRTYLFDLVAQRAGGPALYALRFTYPATPPKPVEPAAPVPIAAAAPPPAPSPLDLNFGWTKHGSKRLLPRRIFDDGKSVYLAWDTDAAIPAMLMVAPDGTEAPVNYVVKGDFVVVDGVPARLMLRAGRETAALDRATRLATANADPATRIAER